MIVGNGDLASVVTDRPDRLYFFSGVSNSQETRESEYKREVDLLYAQPKGLHTVYCSSLSVFYSDSRYAAHKRDMERRVKATFALHTILRIGNITWGKNPNTIINFLKNKVAHGEAVTVQDVYRYIVDKEEFLYWVDMIPNWSCEINIPGKRMKVAEILARIERGKL